MERMPKLKFCDWSNDKIPTFEERMLIIDNKDYKCKEFEYMIEYYEEEKRKMKRRTYFKNWCH